VPEDGAGHKGRVVLIWIIRHGKADQESPTGRDADRPLRPRGQRQARWLAAQLAGRDDAPRRLFASPAARARATGEIVAEGLGLAAEFDERLLVDEPAGPVVDLLGALWQADAALRVAVVGHNPQLSMLARALGAPDCALRTGEAVAIAFAGELELGAGAVVGALRLEEE
jgi:phosphohistidine phosphatase